jgi:hypothetical protein
VPPLPTGTPLPITRTRNPCPHSTASPRDLIKLLRSLLATGLITGLASTAQALPITDVVQPPSPVSLSSGVAFLYTHDLLAHGFDPLSDTLTGATLTLDLTGPGGQPLAISLDGDQVFDSSLNTLGPITVTLSYLQADGLLNVTLTKGGGAGSSFSFVRSTLFADGVAGDPGNDIPEPVTLALLGIGLLVGVAPLRRSRRA